MQKSLMFVFASWFTAVLTSQALADILVLNNGVVYIGKVSSAASGSLRVTTKHGDQFFPKNQVSGYYPTPEGMEAEGYLEAGILLLREGHRDTAKQLFERCVRYDPSYRDRCAAALRGQKIGAVAESKSAGADAKVSEEWEQTAEEHPTTGERRPSCWQARVLSTVVTGSYSEVGGQLRITPSRPDAEIAQVRVEFLAISADSRSLEERSSAINSIDGVLPKRWSEALGPGGKWQNTPCRLFVSYRVRLQLPDGSMVTPGFTGDPPGPGWTIADEVVSVTGPGKDPGALNHIRQKGITSILVLPRRKISLTLIYVVPKGIRRASLCFYDLSPIEVWLTRPVKP